MKAALSARQDKNLAIAGRTSALAITGVDDTIKRAKAYEAAGVDAIFLAGGLTVEAIEAVSSEIRIPLITGGGAGSLADLDWMAANRVRVALQGHAPFSAAVQAVYNTLKALRDGTKPAVFPLPLNGTRVFDPPAGWDVCWRRELPPDTAADPLRARRWTGWNRAYLSSGRLVDSQL